MHASNNLIYKILSYITRNPIMRKLSYSKDPSNNLIYKILSYVTRNPIMRKSSYSKDPSGHLDSSWIASGSIQSPRLDLEPKGVTRFLCNWVTLHVTRLWGNQVIQKTLLDKWILPRLYLDLSKVLDYSWNQKA